MDRRRFLQLLAAAGGATALGSAAYYFNLSPSGNTPPDDNNSGNGSNDDIPIDLSELPDVYRDFLEWLRGASEPFRGDRIDIFLLLEADSRALNRRNIEFAGVTGTNPRYDLKPFALNLQNSTLALRTGAPKPDVLHFHASNLSLFKDHVIPPRELASRYPDLTFPGLDFDDFDPLALSLNCKYPQVLPGQTVDVEPELVGLPFNTPMMIHFYREDLYQEQGLQPPSNWDEYVEDARIIDEALVGTVGSVSQASPIEPVIYEFYNHLRGFGGEFWRIEPDGVVPVIDDQASIEALENFIRLKDVSHPSSSGFTWDGVGDQLRFDVAAQATTHQEIAAIVEDPVRSQVVGNIGYQVPPRGPEGVFPFYIGEGLAVSEFSQNPELAWLWLQWATFTGTQIMMFRDAVSRYTPTRKSTFEHSKVEELLPRDEYESVRIVREIMESGNVSFEPTFPGSRGMRQTISRQLFQAWQGQKDPKTALEEAQTRIVEEGEKFSF